MTNGTQMKIVTMIIDGQGEDDLDPSRREERFEPSSPPNRSTAMRPTITGDTAREVDEGVQDRASAETIAGEDPGNDDPKKS